MRIDSLEYFIDFYDTGSIAATAHKNYMSEQGMNRILKQLEKEMGVCLFRREGKLIRLTEAGEALAERSRRVVGEYRQMRDAMEYYSGQVGAEGESITLLATPCAALCLLPLLDIQKPGLFPFAVNIMESDLDEFADAAVSIREGRAIGVATIPAQGFAQEAIGKIHEKGLELYHLLESDVIALVPSASPFSQLPYLPSESYKDAKNGAMGVACPNDKMVIKQLGETIAGGNIRLVTNNIQLIKGQIRRGQVIMLLPGLILESMKVGQGITGIPLDKNDYEGGYAIRMALILPENYRRWENVATVVDYVSKVVKERIEQSGGGSYSRALL